MLYIRFRAASKLSDFENINLSTEASVTNCFLQDEQGMIWIGSNKGLFSYNGYSVQSHPAPDEQSNAWIYCGQIINDTFLYLGTDNGMLVYNYKTDLYETPPITFPADIRSLALQGETLWIGTLNGLYNYTLSSRTLKRFDTQTYKGLPHTIVYSVIRSQDNHIYVGTYNGLSQYTSTNDSFKYIPLPVSQHKIISLSIPCWKTLSENVFGLERKEVSLNILLPMET